MSEELFTTTALATSLDPTQQDILPQAGPSGRWSARWIRLGTMRPALRALTLVALTLVALALLVATTVLLATAGLTQPQVSPEIGSLVPVSVGVGLPLLLALGFAYLFAGALRAHWSVRWLVTVGVTAILLAPPDGPIQRTNATAFQQIISSAEVAMVAILWIAAGAVTVRGLMTRRGMGAATGEATSSGGRFLSAAAILLAFYGLDAMWSLVAGGRLSAAEPAPFLTTTIEQLVPLTYLLIAVLLWTSPSYMEVGEGIGQAVAGLTRRLRATWLLAGLTLLLAGWAAVTSVLGGGVDAGSLLAVVGLLAAGAVVALAARVARAWPARVPPQAVLLGVALIYSEVLPEVVANTFNIEDPAKYWLNLLAPAIGLLLFVTLGIFLLVRGRVTARPALLASGLFLVYAWLLYGPYNLMSLLQTAGWRLPTPISFDYSDVRLLTAFLAAALVLGVLVFGRRLRDVRTPLVAALLAVAGVEAIHWALKLSDAIGKVNTTTIGIGVFFLVTVLWDVLTSGEEVTNGASRGFPRDARVLLYLGYNVVGAAVLLAVTTAHGADIGRITGDVGAIQTIVLAGGALTLGTALVAATSVMRLGTWRWRERAATVAAPPSAFPLPSQGRTSAWAGLVAQIVVAVVGVALTAGLTLALVERGRPPQQTTTLPSPHAYQTLAPGSHCAAGAATWLLVPQTATITCTAQGTAVDLNSVATSGGLKSVTMGFIPAEKTFAADYSVSIRVDFQGARRACLFVTTRVEATGEYIHQVCADGTWSIDRLDPTTVPILASGKVAHPLATATVTATAQGSTQTLAIDGTTVGQATDTTYTTTDAVTMLLTSPQGGTVLLSDFVYTPLSA